MRSRTAFLEPLEARIAPALTVINPVADIIGGAGQTGTTIELSQMFDPFVVRPGHSVVTFTLNLDSDPNTPGIQTDFDPNTPGNQPARIVIELFDDEAPLTVQNFLRYVENPDNAADYVGTFFHRAISGFVLQGGGFSANAPSEHIETFPEVHNEFSATRSNTLGTVAMAKTELSPNSATSEWFINLADNSGNLDSQNGGFTVFGQVIEGMDVVNKVIALIPSGNSTPLQNYTTGKVVADNLITVTNTSVVHAYDTKGFAEGITFSNITIKDAVSGQVVPDPAITAILEGSTTLKLGYVPQKAGVYTVEFTATRGEDTVTQSFKVTSLPNIIANVTDDKLQTILAPGDQAKIKLELSNTGSGAYLAKTKVNLYLSHAYDDEFKSSDPYDPNVRVVDSGDLLIGTIDLPNSLYLLSGKQTEIEINAQLPDTLFGTRDGKYRLIAEVVTDSSADAGIQPVQELFLDDNVGSDGRHHASPHGFGDVRVTQTNVNVSTGGRQVVEFGSRDNLTLNFREADGDMVTLGFKGQGSGFLNLVGGDGDTTFMNLVVSGTTFATHLDLKIKGTKGVAAGDGRLPLNNIDISSSIGQVNLSQADASGYITASGGLKSLKLGDVEGGKTMQIGFAAPLNTQKASIAFGRVNDFSVESIQPIAKLTAIEWLDADGDDDSIIANALSSLVISGKKQDKNSAAIAGDFGADLFLGGGKLSSLKVAGAVNGSSISLSSDAGTLSVGKFVNSQLEVKELNTVSKLTVAGGIENSTITVAGELKNVKAGSVSDSQFKFEDKGSSNFTVVDAMTDSTLISVGDLGTIKVGSMIGSSVFAGTEARPDALEDFTRVSAIKSFILTNKKTGTFEDSQVAASSIGTVAIQSIKAANDGTAFGFVADSIKKYSRVGGGKLVDDPGTSDVATDYLVLLL